MIRILEFNFLTRMQICLIIFLHLFSAVQPILLVYKALLSLANVLVDVPLAFLLNQKHSPTVSKTFKKEYDYIVGVAMRLTVNDLYNLKPLFGRFYKDVCNCVATDMERAWTDYGSLEFGYCFLWLCGSDLVGAGSAGSVVASRLSEIPCVNVLLLEAGGAPPLLTEIPIGGMATWFTKVDWEFRTVPQRHTGRGLVNRELPLPRGKMLGGSSSMNNLLYVRGNRNNYDGWADQGAKGWSYKDVLPYFKKLEDNRDPEFLENGYHNKSGPVTVERPKYEPLLKKTYYEALKSFGFDFLDPNAERQTGIYDIQGTTRDGQRCSTAKAYLVPAENRENLDIITNAMVKKVLIEKRRAVGVEFDLGGQTYQVKANREVIVSAGSIKSPQLLMLSGLGPTEELSKFNISVISDLPVGKNFHDQAAAVMVYSLGLKNPSIAIKSINPESLVKYFKNRSGPLASLLYFYYVGWFRGNTTSSTIDKPNNQIYFGEVTTAIIAAPFYGLRPEVYEAYLGPYLLEPLLLCLVQQTQPRSKGSVTLKSTSIYDQPLIDPNYFSDVRDEDDMIQGMQLCEKVALSKPLRSLGSRPLKTFIPGCEKYASDKVKYFRCQLRTALVSAQHSVGSVKMGDPSDPTTVLDPKLRVKTIKGLRVVDGSVMPLVTSGNTNIPIIMIAEKASDMIKETINCQSEDIVTET